jgi:small basic protein
MIAIAAVLLLLGIVLGAVSHLPVPVTLIATAVIGGWLLIFAVRERIARTK